MKIFSLSRAVLLIALLSSVTPEIAAADITPAEARARIGEIWTVCGEVRSGRSVEGGSTFLFLERDKPQPLFAVAIPNDSRRSFSKAPEAYYKGKKICITGKIVSRGGLPQIVVLSPSGIRIDTPPRVARDCIPRSQCCKVCVKGKACGNGCISSRYTCRSGRGCACNASEICR